MCQLLWKLCSWGSRKPLGYNGQFRTEKSWHDETFGVPDLLDYYSSNEPYYSDEETARLFRRIGELKRRGVDVVAYVERDHPIYAKITESHGYDPAKIERELRAAGAEILEYPTNELTTFDGIHLDPPSEEKFSHLLGQALARRLPAHTQPLGASCPWPLQTRR